MKILIVTDAWKPQGNGVVRTLEMTAQTLIKMGHDPLVVGPDLSRRGFVWPLPFYSSIKLEFCSRSRLFDIFNRFDPEAVHIAVEGPLGWTARRICLEKGLPFSTAFHTRIPEYARSWVPRPFKDRAEDRAYKFVHQFHDPSCCLMATTKSMVRILEEREFKNVALWSRGVDGELFKPYGKDFDPYRGLKRPILLFAGRLSKEKNIEAFCALKTQGSKVVVGEGPWGRALESKFKNDSSVHFLGYMTGEPLARAYAAADLFVFPSKTDTFGLVLLEACSSGLRVAAYPVPGPKDVLGVEEAEAFAVLDNDLQKAVDRALALPDVPARPRAFVQKNYTWERCTDQFLNNLRPAR